MKLSRCGLERPISSLEAGLILLLGYPILFA
jgi:hypothetical protein